MRKNPIPAPADIDTIRELMEHLVAIGHACRRTGPDGEPQYKLTPLGMLAQATPKGSACSSRTVMNPASTAGAKEQGEAMRGKDRNDSGEA